MQTKLHINILQGVVDVEGDPKLVREVYADFKDMLLNGTAFHEPHQSQESAKPKLGSKQKPKRSRSPRVKATDDDGFGSDVAADSPKMDKDLDTSGLSSFYGQFKTKNHSERVLIFLKFLKDELGISHPNTDQIYTCYAATNERVPKVFSQAFRDASGRRFGYIDYKSPTNIAVTTIGNNYFNLDLEKAAE